MNIGEPSSAGVRARPLKGQGLPSNMKVECSRKMRTDYPVGTKFVIQCKITDKEGGNPFLYSRFDWPYRVVTDEESTDLVGSFNRPKHEQ